MRGSTAVTEKQIELQSRRRAVARRRKNIYIILFVILLIAFFYIIWQPFARIKNVEVTSNGVTDSSDVKYSAEQFMRGSYLFIIPRNSILFFSRSKFTKLVNNNFPRVTNITFDIGRTLNIKLSESEFQFLYCSVTVPNNNNTDMCAFMNMDGILRSYSPAYSYAPIFGIYVPNAILPALGNVAIATSEITRVNDLRTMLASYGFKIHGFVYGSEYDKFVLDTGANFENLPEIRIPFSIQADDLKILLDNAFIDERTKKLLVDNQETIAYIDVRFKNQIVYRKKE